MKFILPIADASNYPKPSILATPSKVKFSFRSNNSCSNSQFLDEVMFTKNGRSALALIITALNLKSSDTVLLPEYHCPAMVEPFLWAGIKVKYYQVNRDLHVDLEHFSSLITPDVKACVLVHFFGFSTNINNAAVIANQNNCLIIEDCAHGFFSQKIKNNGIESAASFCSLNKIFSSHDGGLLTFSKRAYRQRVHTIKSPNVLHELKHWLGLMGVAKLLGFLKPAFIKRETQKSKGEIAENTQVKEPSAQTFRYFDEKDLERNCYRATQWQIKVENLAEISLYRQENFTYLFKALKESKTGRPVFSPENEIVPYVFPFLLNNSEDFDFIRKQGIQILRWEEFCQTPHKEVEELRTRLIQIPCHQNLTKNEMNKIIAIINKENKSYVE